MGKQSKTRVEYEVRGLYGDAWEMVTTEGDYQSAKEMARCYRLNEPQTRFGIRKVYAVLPEYEQELRDTLWRINRHHGSGDIQMYDDSTLGTSAYVRWQHGGRWYTYTLLDGDRVRFRGIVRRIGYVPTWAR